MISGKHIVIGVTGGIAAYKAVYLVRQLQETGAEVRVTMTEAAGHFIGRETFAALTRHAVPVGIFPENADEINNNWTRHIQWAEWADAIVVAPCTANSLAKIVHGFSDSMLTTTILAARCPVLICPTMDGEMYKATSTRTNLEKARQLGFHIMEPDHGYLASGMEGTGRLPEPEAIIDHIQTLPDFAASGSGKKNDAASFLKGKQVVVTGGATREFLDPVRFLSNPSTGKMGVAMAEAAASFGAMVTFLHAESVDISRISESITTSSFVSTDDLFHLIKSRADADIIIMTAAVSDFRPVQQHSRKVKKEDAQLELALERTPDILQWLGEHRNDGQILIGFAMETGDLIDQAREKRIRKGSDWIVANDLSLEGSGFAIDTNRVFLVGADSETSFEGTKIEVARNVLQHIFVS